MSEKLKIVIVGGGTAGWMSAAALAAAGVPSMYEVVLIESDRISTIGVGEATVPAIREFNDQLGILEPDLMQKTGATFKLGIEFTGWGRQDSSYVHPFGDFGTKLGGVGFHHQWLRARQNGFGDDLEKYSFAVQAARQEKFDFPASDPLSINATFSYAYHIDAGRYAEYLREYAEGRGVRRFEGTISQIELEETTGNVRAVLLESGEKITANYFVDCSGFHSLLMEKLNVDFESWSQWLLCDSAITAPTAKKQSPSPYTKVKAKVAGWQWEIPLQHRTGNGYVYSSQYTDDEAAKQSFLSDLGDAPIVELKLIRFNPGRRAESWAKNVISVGLSSGFLEPLESTSIYLIQVAVKQLIDLLPGDAEDEILAREFNRNINREYDRVRDFLILHYKLTERQDSEFWRYCKDMDVPEPLAKKISLFSRRGYIDQYRYGLFSPPSWLAVFLGQGVTPQLVDPLSSITPLSKVEKSMTDLADNIQTKVRAMPSHAEFLAQYDAILRTEGVE